MRAGMIFLCLMLSGIGGARAAEQEDWALHGQSTFIEQYHPAFRSLYRGANSLDPGSRGNETFNITVYGGLRPWDGGEAWADLEMDQGFAFPTRYFALGGLGILIGDGRLDHYARENVMEAYYSAALWAGIHASLDYQFIAHPAYNADRGPVSVLGFRLHGAF